MKPNTLTSITIINRPALVSRVMIEVPSSQSTDRLSLISIDWFHLSQPWKWALIQARGTFKRGLSGAKSATRQLRVATCIFLPMGCVKRRFFERAYSRRMIFWKDQIGHGREERLRSERSESNSGSDHSSGRAVVASHSIEVTRRGSHPCNPATAPLGRVPCERSSCREIRPHFRRPGVHSGLGRPHSPVASGTQNLLASQSLDGHFVEGRSMCRHERIPPFFIPQFRVILNPQ